jgi:hypothetical protein
MRAQCGDEILLDWILASLALGCEHAEEILATIRASITLVKAVLAEFPTAFRTHEMLRMERLAQGGHTTLKRNAHLSPPSIDSHP